MKQSIGTLYILGFGLVSASFGQQPAPPSPIQPTEQPIPLSNERILTDTQGRTITATLLAADASTVQVRRDGREFTLPLATLSQADQDHIQRWRTSPQGQQANAMKFAKRRHSVATALELCGGITDDYPIRIPMTDNSAASVALAKEVGAITQAAFVSAGNKLSAALLLAAQQASMQHGNTLIIINETTKHPGISEIQAILGKADSTEEGRLEAVTWHKYGWCHFGVSNARVVKLRADCDKSNN